MQSHPSFIRGVCLQTIQNQQIYCDPIEAFQIQVMQCNLSESQSRVDLICTEYDCLSNVKANFNLVGGVQS